MQDATNLADITASSTRDKLKTLEGQLIKTLIKCSLFTG